MSEVAPSYDSARDAWLWPLQVLSALQLERFERRRFVSEAQARTWLLTIRW